jgi:hypothetical protein
VHYTSLDNEFNWRQIKSWKTSRLIKNNIKNCHSVFSWATIINPHFSRSGFTKPLLIANPSSSYMSPCSHF